MKKLTLTLESLTVESFHTICTREGTRGTVNGHTGDDCYRITQDAACGPYTGGPNPEPSAGGTCVFTFCFPLTSPDYN
jgi:hypothetical protein